MKIQLTRVYGLYDGCSQISKHSCWNVSRLWEQELSCSNKTPFNSCPPHLLQIVSFSLFTVTFTAYQNTLIMPRDWSMWIPKQREHTFSHYWLSFVLWFAVVDPCFIIKENMPPKGVTFMILVQEAVTSMLFYKLFWNPPCIHTMKVKFVVDDLIGRTVINLQLVCHFIDKHALVEN
jgi:hypothetical protein